MEYTFKIPGGGELTLRTGLDAASESDCELESRRNLGLPPTEVRVQAILTPKDAQAMADWMITAVYHGKEAEAYWDGGASEFAVGAVEFDGCFDDGYQITIANDGVADQLFFPNTDTEAVTTLNDLAHALIAWGHGAE